MGGTVAEVEIPAEEFALYETFTAIDDVAFEVERVVAHEDDRVMPFVWVSTDDVDGETLEEVLVNDPSVTGLELLADLDGEWLYRMEWVSQTETLVRILVEENGTILAASGNDESWNLRIIFPDRESLSRTYEYCQNNGLTMNILNIYRLEEGQQGRFGLTDDQHDVLKLAYERGYFRVPRDATAQDLAKELNITHQSVSERLRRAEENLVENAIILGRGAEGPNRK